MLFSDPPLNEEDIPTGLWLCHTCRSTNQTVKISQSKSNDNDQSHSEPQSDQSRPSTPAISESVIIAKARLINKRSNSRISTSSDHSIYSDKVKIELQSVSDEPCEMSSDVKIEPIENGDDSEHVPIPIVSLNPLEELTRVAAIMNPRQFELPREMNTPFMFPGDDRGLYFASLGEER